MSDDAITHDPCCSSHGEPMTCAKYRRTHFVEVRPCCSHDREAMREEYMRDLIEKSSLGTPAAKALRESVPEEVAREIVRRAFGRES